MKFQLKLIFILALLLSISFCDSSSYEETSSEEYNDEEEHEITEGVRCRNTEDLLKYHPEDVVLCAKRILRRTPRLRSDSDVTRYDLGDVVLTEYQKVTSVQWPYYARGYDREEGDIDPFRWFHTVQIYVPQGLEAPKTAFFWISNRQNNPNDDVNDGERGTISDGNPDDLDYKAKEFIEYARQMNAIVVQLYHVPNQYIYINGELQREDNIVAWTWRKFIENPQKYTFTPVHLAMSVATQSIMTWSKRQIRRDTGHKIQNWVIGGESKRGWAAWLTALADTRVKALTPAVIDILNVNTQYREIFKTYGNRWPIALSEYNTYGVANMFNFSPAHKRNLDLLNKIMDPIEYRYIPKFRKRLEVPKYIVNSAGDDFFLPQGSQLFIDLLPNREQTFEYRQENCGHNIPRPTIFPNGISSFVKKIAQENQQFPSLQYQTYYEPQKLRFEVQYTCGEGLPCEESDLTVKFWVAENNIARDFRYNCALLYQAYYPDIAGTTGIYLEQELTLTRVDDRNWSVSAEVQASENGYKSAFVQIKDASDFTTTTSGYILQGENVDPHAQMPQRLDMPFCLQFSPSPDFI